MWHCSAKLKNLCVALLSNLKTRSWIIYIIAILTIIIISSILLSITFYHSKFCSMVLNSDCRNNCLRICACKHFSSNWTNCANHLPLPPPPHSIGNRISRFQRNAFHIFIFFSLLRKPKIFFGLILHQQHVGQHRRSYLIGNLYCHNPSSTQLKVGFDMKEAEAEVVPSSSSVKVFLS